MLSIGGFMGMGNKLFAMPWKAFEFHAPCTSSSSIAVIDKLINRGFAAGKFDAFVKSRHPGEILGPVKL
jgi:hypothetical protein